MKVAIAAKICPTFFFLCIGVYQPMDSETPEIIETAERSELQKFAQSFHQDWDIERIDYFEGARRYQLRLSPERRGRLAVELYSFIEQNTHTSSHSLIRRWADLGSGGGWQPKLGIHEGLEQFYLIIANKKFE